MTDFLRTSRNNEAAVNFSLIIQLSKESSEHVCESRKLRAVSSLLREFAWCFRCPTLLMLHLDSLSSSNESLDASDVRDRSNSLQESHKPISNHKNEFSASFCFYTFSLMWRKTNRNCFNTPRIWNPRKEEKFQAVKENRKNPISRIESDGKDHDERNEN